eukprot:5736193-Pyramimonas_sp.AAC.1
MFVGSRRLPGLGVRSSSCASPGAFQGARIVPNGRRRAELGPENQQATSGGWDRLRRSTEGVKQWRSALACLWACQGVV